MEGSKEQVKTTRCLGAVKTEVYNVRGWIDRSLVVKVKTFEWWHTGRFQECDMSLDFCLKITLMEAWRVDCKDKTGRLMKRIIKD